MEMSIRLRLEGYMRDSKESQGMVAKKVGISPAAFSQYMNCKYPSPEQLEPKFINFLEKAESREELGERIYISGDVVETSFYKRIMGVLEYCRLQQVMGLVSGDAGLGKSITAKTFLGRNNDVVYVLATPCTKSPRAFLKQLARILRVVAAGTQDEIFFKIVDKLSEADRMIIVDEAQHLNLETLENIRALHDALGVGIVLIGNETIATKMLGKQQAEFAQLFSRVAIREKVSTFQAMRSDVELLFPDAGEKSQEYLLRVIKSKWGIRGARFLWTNCTNNDTKDDVGLKGMANQMGMVVY